MHGNKLYTLQPNLHEQLVEMQVMSITLPEDIERMKSAKKRDQEQVRLRMCVQAGVSDSLNCCRG
jgi:creatinine amidohydrolase/Fe(II)-dependent formamide hydrolase-like protein